MTVRKKPPSSAKLRKPAKTARSSSPRSSRKRASDLTGKTAGFSSIPVQANTQVMRDPLSGQKKLDEHSERRLARHGLGFRVLTWPLRVLWGQKYRLMSMALVVTAILLVASEGVRMNTKDARFNTTDTKIADIPHRQVGLVLGAGVLPDGTPTGYLKNRLESAVKLYESGRVGRLVMSGDNSASHYDEPTVMKDYAVKRGVPAGDIVIDYAGFNTYDSCYRAREVFKLTSVTVITQGYHLPRAVMTCQQLGIDTVGVAAEHKGRDWTVSYLMREHVSTAKALVQMYLKPPPTVLGATETE